MQNVTIDRDKYIGGSDIPIIMGISPFKTRWELLQEKAGLVQNSFEGNEYTEYGNVMEPKIRDFINARKKDKFVEGKHIDGDVRCHTDGINKTTILEIKTTSNLHTAVDDYRVYLVQLLFYMNHTNKSKGKLAVYARPRDFNEEFNEKLLQVFDIKMSDYKELTNEIEDAVEQFRIDLMKIKENPFIIEEELLPVDLTELANEVVKLENELIQMKTKEKELKEIKEQLKVAMENNNVKKWETPNGVKITLVADTADKIVKKFNEKLFKENNEDLWDEYSEEKIQKGKSGYVKITLPKEA